MKPKRPIMGKYPGSKWRLAPWIHSFFPKRHHTYGEPYVGGGSVMIRKDRSPMEHVCDNSGELINLLIVLRDRRDELISQIERTYWSPVELELAYEPTDDPLERARRFYARCWMSVHPFDSKPYFRRQMKMSQKGGRPNMKPAAKGFAETNHLFWAAQRLRGVTIENMDALKFIKKYDYERALFYVDPIYLPHTRKRKKISYATEMTLEDHENLAEVLLETKGMVVLSHYRCGEYDEWYGKAGWTRHDTPSRVDGKGTHVESVYVSPRTQEALEREKRDYRGPLLELIEWTE